MECLFSLALALVGVVLHHSDFKDIHWTTTFKSKWVLALRVACVSLRFIHVLSCSRFFFSRAALVAMAYASVMYFFYFSLYV